MNKLFSDKVRPISVAEPADLNGAAVTGKRIKLDSAEKIALIAQFGDSTAADVKLTWKQHDAASGGNSKVLNTKLPWFVKTLAETSFTKKNTTNADYSEADASTELAADPGIVMMEALAEELDTENGYYWVSVDVADSTAAKIMSALYHLHGLENEPGYDAVY